MKLLDELDQEIDHQKQTQGAQQKQLDDYYHQQIKPAMAKIYDYLKELTEKLGYLQRDIEVSYYVSRYGDMDGLKQGDYQLNVENDMDVVNIGFSCKKEGFVTLEIQGGNAIQWQKDYFHEHSLTFEEKRLPHLKIPTSQFRLHCQVPVMIQCKANRENSRIDLILYNLEQLAKVEKNINPATVDENFLDQIGLSLLRKGGASFGADLTATQQHKAIAKTPTTATQPSAGSSRFRPGSMVMVQRSDGSIEKGWRVIAANQSVPASVRQLLEKDSVLCSRTDGEATNYKIYSTQELVEIQEKAKK